ncbi:hypothetical protein PL321_10545 [Caloramator sp. mosi_1]|uniref:hypothetical protein n=1 Tax=Caloramator sp. mosi_1 TaxID=3023090 RepID=UPI002361DCF5|nr:hypothetical protein [Caloramator sp. mosi_1]WDC83229.1 hypothetical protein PL321_10545 [Caloramator sp. mosi_1]
MFKLTDRDKKMLLILLIFIIGLAFYYTYSFTLGKIDSLKEENSKKQARLEELNRAVEIFNKNKDKIEETKLNYYDISQKLANNLDEKFCVVDVLNLLRKYDATINDLPISAKQEYKYNKNNKKIEGAFYYTLKISTQLSYDKFKNMLVEVENFNTVYSIDNVSIVPILNGENIATTFDLNLYGYRDEKAPIRQWKDFNLNTGKINIFSSISGITNENNKSNNEYIEKIKIF